ncbi:MAG: thioredoxin-dependent peroxiredoxin [Actinomycetota bacterium]|jgi:peroxiredoxin Q/BCP|nr:thioredoxin-dependent peroxiredoxin [Actinomycetota bacterium]
MNTVVLGASFDSVEDNKVFADAQSFGFHLLSDADRSVGASYEVLRDADDSASDYPKRISYLIDPGGVIRRSYEVTDVDAHADDVLADLAALQSDA